MKVLFCVFQTHKHHGIIFVILFFRPIDIVEALDVFRGCWVDAKDLRPSSGDIIDFNRDVYTHHGIYVGNGNVVHQWAAGHVPFCVAEIRLESLKSRSIYSLKYFYTHYD